MGIVVDRSWIAVADSLPPLHQQVLVCSPSLPGWPCEVAERREWDVELYGGDGWEWSGLHGSLNSEITHWMELPGMP